MYPVFCFGGSYFNLVALFAWQVNSQRVQGCWSDDRASSSKNLDFSKIFFASQMLLLRYNLAVKWKWERARLISHQNLVKLKSAVHSQPVHRSWLSQRMVPWIHTGSTKGSWREKMCVSHSTFLTGLEHLIGKTFTFYLRLNWSFEHFVCSQSWFSLYFSFSF